MIAFICAMQIQNNAFAIQDIINIFLLNKNGCVDARLLFSNVFPNWLFEGSKHIYILSLLGWYLYSDLDKALKLPPPTTSIPSYRLNPDSYKAIPTSPRRISRTCFVWPLPLAPSDLPPPPLWRCPLPPSPSRGQGPSAALSLGARGRSSPSLQTRLFCFPSGIINDLSHNTLYPFTSCLFVSVFHCVAFTFCLLSRKAHINTTGDGYDYYCW